MSAALLESTLSTASFFTEKAAHSSRIHVRCKAPYQHLTDAVVRQVLSFAIIAEAAIQQATGVPVLFLHGSGGSYKQVSACVKPTQLQFAT